MDITIGGLDPVADVDIDGTELFEVQKDALGAKMTLEQITKSNVGYIPTADQKAALAGTSGTPSATNPYVTTEDGRLPVAPGDAPVYGCRAWVNFDGTTADNVSGTYAIAGTVCTVTKAAHGHIVGHRVFLDFTSGTGADRLYTITGVTADTYTVTHASATTSGNVTELRRKINASGNVHSVAYQNAVGKFIINFLIKSNTTYYTASGNGRKPDSNDDANVMAQCGGLVGLQQNEASMPIRYVYRDGTPLNIDLSMVQCFW